MAKTDACQEENGVFSLDLSQHGHRTLQHGSEVVNEISVGRLETLGEFIADQTAFESQLAEEVRRSKQSKRLSGVARADDCALLARELRLKGYRIREHGPGTNNPSKKKSQLCLECISHNYLTCSESFIADREELIVEPYFREEFQIAHPTQSYKAVLSILPAEFVGTASKLATIIQAVSEAAAEAFSAAGRALPPWRRTSAALSKWDLAYMEGSQDTQQKLEELRQKAKGKTAVAGAAKQIAETHDIQGQVVPHDAHLHFRASLVRPVKRVSMLARGLADMVTVQKPPYHRKPEAAVKTDGLNRTISWDFSGLQPITTVRRAGKVQ